MRPFTYQQIFVNYKNYGGSPLAAAYGREEYYINGKRDRIDGPAVTWYYESGKIKIELYCINDLYHRVDGPAIIRYCESGKIESAEYYVNDIIFTGFVTNFERIGKRLIFEYIRKYPEHIKEVALLARHNDWLNEKELELLDCLNMFK